MTVSSAWKDSDTIFALVSDQTDWHLLKVDLNIEEVYFTTITVSTGSDFEIIGSALYGSSTEFYYAGYTKSLTDGTQSTTNSKKIGFVMISDTSEEETNCLSFSHDWNPTTGGTAISHDNTITWNLEETSGARIDNYKTTIIPSDFLDTSETKISNEVE